MPQCSAAEVGVILRHWIWRNGRRWEDLQLDYLLPYSSGLWVSMEGGGLLDLETGTKQLVGEGWLGGEDLLDPLKIKGRVGRKAATGILL